VPHHHDHSLDGGSSQGVVGNSLWNLLYELGKVPVVVHELLLLVVNLGEKERHDHTSAKPYDALPPYPIHPLTISVQTLSRKPESWETIKHVI
jgi:hypothetical protein